MPSWSILAMLVGGGAALVAQNVLMARLSEGAASPLTALLMNSVVGVVVLASLSIARAGPSGLAEAIAGLSPWSLVPGLLGTFFVFVSLAGYRTVGAVPTIAVLVASQLLFGLLADMLRVEVIDAESLARSLVGIVLLLAGLFLVIDR